MSNRVFFALLLLVVLLAAVPRALTYDFSLPYIDHPDEPNKYLAALEWRGQHDGLNYNDGKPPAYAAVNYIAQHLLEPLGYTGLAPTIRALRVLSVLADLGIVVLLALTVRLAAGDLPALLAAAIWGGLAVVVENNVYAVPDPLMALCAVGALYLAARSLLQPGASWLAVWSVVLGLVATLLKYPGLWMIAPGGVAAMILTAQAPRRGWRLLAAQAGLVAATLIWIFFIYGLDPSSAQSIEGRELTNSGLANALTPSRILNNIWVTLQPLTPFFFLGTLAAGAGAYRLARRRGLPTVRAWVVPLCVSMLFGPWLVAAYVTVTLDRRVRDVLPATAGMLVLLAVALAQVIWVLPRRWGQAGAVLAVVVFIGVPQAAPLTDLIADRSRPGDTRVALRAWVDTHLEAGTVLVTGANDKTFNPLWGGLSYAKWFDWWVSDDFTERPVAAWREDVGVQYAVVPTGQWEAWQTTERGQRFLDDLLLLRAFPSGDQTRGPGARLYRLYPPEQTLDVGFGDHITLVGYDATRPTSPADALQLRLYWQASTPPASNYSLYIHLAPPGTRQQVAQLDAPPAAPQRPTLTWGNPTETLVSPAFTLPLPAGLTPGPYRVIVGLYDYDTLQRAPVDSGPLGDGYELFQFEVD